MLINWTAHYDYICCHLPQTVYASNSFKINLYHFSFLPDAVFCILSYTQLTQSTMGEGPGEKPVRLALHVVTVLYPNDG